MTEDIGNTIIPLIGYAEAAHAADLENAPFGGYDENPYLHNQRTIVLNKREKVLIALLGWVKNIYNPKFWYRIILK